MKVPSENEKQCLLLCCLLKEVWHPRRHQRRKESNDTEISIMLVYDSGIELVGKPSFQETFSQKEGKMCSRKM